MLRHEASQSQSSHVVIKKALITKPDFCHAEARSISFTEQLLCYQKSANYKNQLPVMLRHEASLRSHKNNEDLNCNPNVCHAEARSISITEQSFRYQESANYNTRFLSC